MLGADFRRIQVGGVFQKYLIRIENFLCFGLLHELFAIIGMGNLDQCLGAFAHRATSEYGDTVFGDGDVHGFAHI